MIRMLIYFFHIDTDIDIDVDIGIDSNIDVDIAIDTKESSCPTDRVVGVTWIYVNKTLAPFF